MHCIHLASRHDYIRQAMLSSPVGSRQYVFAALSVHVDVLGCCQLHTDTACELCARERTRNTGATAIAFPTVLARLACADMSTSVQAHLLAVACCCAVFASCAARCVPLLRTTPARCALQSHASVQLIGMIAEVEPCVSHDSKTQA